MSKLWYKQSATIWEEALPIGNGRLGAMIFGGVDRERIQVNEESVWYGGKQNRINPDAKEALPEVRRLLEEGQISKAQKLLSTAMTGCPEGMRQYQTLGDLRFTFYHKGEAAEYTRELDLEQSLCKVTYRVQDTVYERSFFASKPDEAICMRFTAKGSLGISFDLKLDRSIYFDGVRKCDRDGLCLYGNLGKYGACFAMMVRAKVVGGSLRVIGDTLIVEGAGEVVLYFGADTTWQHRNESIEADSADYLYHYLWDSLQKAMSATYEELFQRHLQDYLSLYGRVCLSLGEESHLPTDERLAGVSAGKTDLGLHKLLFDYGRYLLISCSREGGLPANLQGIWNQDMQPAWDSKYTININTEMNYWPAEVCGLGENHLPLFELLWRIRESGRETAEKMYGCRGFVAHHNTDMFADTAPQDLYLPATYWTQGGAWLCTHIWTHYIYTKDLAFLKKYFPVLLECALFYVDFLTQYKGYLVTNPSVSPENTYILPNGEKGCCCIGPTMDNQLIRDLFDDCIKSFEVLKEEALQVKIPQVESVVDLMHTIKEKRELLPPTRIGSDGRIMEWLEEYEEEEPGHRHISHLYGLYPSDQISVDETPLLAQAARKTLEKRLENGGGHTGWSRAWIMNHYAKLMDGDEAFFHIEEMLKHSTYPNMFDKHPPFQIDGNFGACAAIARMLVQSNEKRVILLPALPGAWDSGSVKGLRLVHNAEISICWHGGEIVSCRLKAYSDYSTRVYYKEKVWQVSLKAGEDIALIAK